MKPDALKHAQTLLKNFEGCHLHAYPDPLSAMGKAAGARGIERIGRTGLIPPAIADLNATPWTIGYGATGTGIRRGTVWTQEECEKRFAADIDHHWGLALAIWPGIDNLHAKAQAALVSIVYNRGSQLTDKPGSDRRKEMRAIGPLVAKKDYAGIAQEIRNMKRLWTARGLLDRREKEAAMVETP